MLLLIFIFVARKYNNFTKYLLLDLKQD